MLLFLLPGSGDRLAKFSAAALSFLFLGLGNLITPLAVAAQNSPLRQGIHFYGESAQPGVVGQEYFIFQVRGDQIRGAFFAYHSEFACTHGTISAQALDLVVEDPYGEQPPSRFALNLVPQSPVARSGNNIDLTLQGLEEIKTIGATEQDILAACL
ncbi:MULTISPECIES: hypothetical protein [unclassified Synechocystis]|uniref:hypothetical protein n=1 Tax=unclassified Synechocystis TaxID=2640012 RepID=UPI00048DD014|nr:MULTISPECIES: hypothetical protein [unclassified Synechocystis]AIE72773.2 hypothetical protein D082_02440 [Synechocystis sp. PCC 6714]MCT0254586.1 hypothetical protein [Synechocystis sp. CS-94]